ncbi:MAG TPA: aminoglycoside adenylyltransferase domain-containing protein [Chloroflexota bacterium]|nr:aminoglycoside adenylyltransferase domain-containing protein [Chloroflexota bacterium]
MHQPTPYPDVNTVLMWFLREIRAILGDYLRGMYLSGSLALGDFSHERSDIDFVAVTDIEVADDRFAALQAMHARFNAGDSPWATEVEAAYIPLDALRRYDPAHARHPHIQRGAREALVWDQLASDWVLQRHILREHGVIVAGPHPSMLIDPVSPRDMRRAVGALMEEWWGTMPLDPAPLRRAAIGYQAYAVLTMCRMLYTLDHGEVVSKPVAARWAQQELDARWFGLIDRALAWRKDRQVTPALDVDDTVALIQYTGEQCRQQATRHGDFLDETGLDSEVGRATDEQARSC